MNTKRLFQQILVGQRIIQPRTRIVYNKIANNNNSFSTWSSNNNIDKKCWQCQSTNKWSTLFCESCNVIQPISFQLNFFHLLQVGQGENKDEPTFNIDLKLMKKRFLLLQQKAHPDSYSQAPKRQLDYAQLQSSVINKAYHTLKNPLDRAHYILKENGYQVNEGDSSSDSQLLMQVMDFREELEQVDSEKDLMPLKQRNDEKYNETCDKLNLAFEQLDYKKAKNLAIELQYWSSIQIAIREWHQ